METSKQAAVLVGTDPRVYPGRTHEFVYIVMPFSIDTSIRFVPDASAGQMAGFQPSNTVFLGITKYNISIN